MSDNKKYYYIKIKEDFFAKDDIKIIQAMENGYLYTDILLKLYLVSLRNNGKLMLKDHIPYNVKMIATVTNHNVLVVEKALSIFQELGLIEVLDNGAIYMLDIQLFIGQGSTEGDRKKEYREKIKKEKLELKNGQMSELCPPKLEKETEIKQEIEQEIEQEEEYIQQIKNIISVVVNATTTEAKTILKVAQKYNPSNPVEIIKEKIEVLATGNYRNYIASLIQAIKDNWQPPKACNRKNGFNNFEARSYDYEELEKKLLGWEE
ncbi:MAG: phage replisome organizer N-terminal domain-containing protein [Clostridium sp.]